MSDTRPWTCDKCGKVVEPGQPAYGLVRNREARTTRHWACHTPFETLIKGLSDELKRSRK